MVDGVRVAVPNSLDLMAPYVLLEQRDWFENDFVQVTLEQRPSRNDTSVRRSRAGLWRLDLSFSHAGLLGNHVQAD
jgi:hypothetical protein